MDNQIEVVFIQFNQDIEFENKGKLLYTLKAYKDYPAVIKENHYKVKTDGWSFEISFDDEALEPEYRRAI